MQKRKRKKKAGKMGKYFIVFTLLLLFQKCSVIEDVVESGDYTKERKCCYINRTRDTIFFDCNKERTQKILVSVRKKMENHKFLDIDSSVIDQKFIPLSFIYKRITKDSLIDKYFHIIVVSDKKNHEKSDYWFILNEKDWRSKDIIYSYNKTGR